MVSDRALDLGRIKRNVAKMAAQNAPPEHINGYIESQGATLEQIRNYRDVAQPVTQTSMPIQDDFGVESDVLRPDQVGQTSGGELGQPMAPAQEVAANEEMEQKRGIVGRLMDKLRGRAEVGADIQENVRSGEINPIRGGWQQAGNVGMGALMDVGGAAFEGISAAADVIPAGVAAAGSPDLSFGEAYGAARETRGPMGRAALENPVSQGVGNVAGKLYGLGERAVEGIEDENLKRDVMSGLYMLGGGMGSMGKSGAKFMAKEGAEEAAKKRGSSPVSDILAMGKDRRRAIGDAVMPDNKAYQVRKAALGKEKSGWGPLSTYSKKWSDWENSVIDEFDNLKVKDGFKTRTINPVKDNYQDMINTANKAVGVENKAMVKALGNSTATRPTKEVLSKVNAKIDEYLDEFPVIKGEQTLQTNRENILASFQKVLSRQDSMKPLDFYKALDEFDEIMQKQYPLVFDEEKAFSGLKIINKGTRDAMKDLIEDMTGNKAFSESMSKQSRLLAGRDNLAQKAWKEGETPGARLEKGLKSYEQVSLSGLPVKGAKDIAKLTTKSAIVPLLRRVEQAINTAKVTPRQLQDLRIYRSGLQDRLQEIQGSEEDQ